MHLQPVITPMPPPSAPPERTAWFALLEQIPGGVLWLDPEGRVVTLNEIAALRLDRSRDECVGQDLFRELLPELEAAGTGEVFRRGMRAGRVALGGEASVEHSARGGRLGIAIRSAADGSTPGALALLEDRTALQTEAERRARAEGLAAVGELVLGVAHEINNPLASIKGFAQLLARDLVEASHANALEIISRESSRVAEIIDRLLAFARQQRRLGRERLGLSALAQETVELRRYALETAGISVHTELDPGLSPVEADVGAIQRVMLVLLGRAERVLNEHEGERRLLVRTRESTDGVVLYVVDSGPGIPRDRLRSLFQDAEPHEGWGATGMSGALAIVREHGGHLWADSVAGEGTAFYLRLPCAQEAVIEEAAAAPPDIHSVADRPLRVLVADDEPTLRLAVSLFLGRHGHQVTQAADAMTALRLAQEADFDVALVDARMPGDGLQLLEQLEAMPSLRGRTVLMSGDHAHGGRGSARGERPYLAKPFDMTEVVRLVEALGR